jgi:pectinesterase
MSLRLACFLGLVATATCVPTSNVQKRTSRTSAPSGCLTVGTSGTYSSIGDALTELASSTSTACIYISAGTYEEQLTIDYGGSLTLYGETTNTGTYKENTVTITHTISSSEAGSLDLSSTVNVVSDGFSMYNINVVNGYGAGSQAVA